MLLAHLSTTLNKQKFLVNTLFFRPFKNNRFEKKKLIFNLFSFKTLFSHVGFYPSTTIYSFMRQTFVLPSVSMLSTQSNTSFLGLKFFTKYFYNGLGYKIFLRRSELFIWVGLTHYTILRVPSTIKVFPKKKRIFIVGTNLIKFKDFLMQIRRIRKIDLYKGKGLLEVKNYKGFIKMKSGKKKQY